MNKNFDENRYWFRTVRQVFSFNLKAIVQHLVIYQHIIFIFELNIIIKTKLYKNNYHW